MPKTTHSWPQKKRESRVGISFRSNFLVIFPFWKIFHTLKPKGETTIALTGGQLLRKAEKIQVETQVDNLAFSIYSSAQYTFEQYLLERPRWGFYNKQWRGSDHGRISARRQEKT